MKINVGKNYQLPGEERKREGSCIFWAMFWFISLVSYSSFLVIMSIWISFWELPIKEVVANVVLFNVPTFIFSIGTNLTFKKSERIRTVEFLIHEYERWNNSTAEYEKLYFYEEVALFENYNLIWDTGDTINRMTEDELFNYCKNLPKSFSSFIGYKTKEEAMEKIYLSIIDLFLTKKMTENISVRNVNTLETFSVNELEEKLSGENLDSLSKSRVFEIFKK